VAAEAQRRARLDAAAPVDTDRTCTQCGGPVTDRDRARCRKCRQVPRRYTTNRQDERVKAERILPDAHCEDCDTLLEHPQFKLCPECRHAREVERRKGKRELSAQRPTRPDGHHRRGRDRTVARNLRQILAAQRDLGRSFEEVWRDAIAQATRTTGRDEREKWMIAFHATRDEWRSAYEREGMASAQVAAIAALAA
jgi:hypothetical protein